LPLNECKSPPHPGVEVRKSTTDPLLRIKNNA
jgi:hypothetical protein